MDSLYYLFYVPEIEQYILDFLDVMIDRRKLISVNKYFYDLISENPVFSEFKKLYRIRKLFFRKENTSTDQHNFLIACCNGYFNIVKYYITNHPHKIDIHHNNDIAFRRSCTNDNLDIAKYLLYSDNKIDIHIMDELVFRRCCAKGLLGMVKFLCDVSMSRNEKINVRILNDAFRLSCLHGHIAVAKFCYLLTME